jgi:hypothetical protein
MKKFRNFRPRLVPVNCSDPSDATMPGPRPGHFVNVFSEYSPRTVLVRLRLPDGSVSEAKILLAPPRCAYFNDG